MMLCEIFSHFLVGFCINFVSLFEKNRECDMIVNFTVGNYKSFKNKKTLSLEATAITELQESIIDCNGVRILPTAVIYGANSSGKSNFLKAIIDFWRLVLYSASFNSSQKTEVIPFLLNNRTSNEPSFFEIELISKTGCYFRYGFEVNSEIIVSEWLYKRTSKKYERCLFVRDGNGIGVTGMFKEGAGLEERTRDNALFLSVVDSFNGKIATDIISTISHMIPMSGIAHSQFGQLSTVQYKHECLRNSSKELFDKLNFGFKDFEIPDDDTLAQRIKAYTYHTVYDDDGNEVGQTRFNMADFESEGTNKFYDIYLCIQATLQVGGTLIIDEFDCKLHPLITQYIIRQFNSPETNPGKGQLIFATHDTNLLSVDLFRRDQIWFVEKDSVGSSDIYSLIEFKGADGLKVRKDRSFEKDYIKGRYGAIPYIK